MPSFDSDGIEIAYESRGEGKPILLVHGFASNGDVNWNLTSWIETLVGAGFRTIAVDNRGHGRSQKLYDPALYSARLMGADAVRLLDHLGIEKAVFMGYSMGARISAFAALDAPGRVAATIWGGFGINMIRGMRNTEEIIAALRARDLSDVTHPVGRQFRVFAEYTKSDLRALAACMAGSRSMVSADELQLITAPVLVAVGDADGVAGDAGELAALLPHGEALVIPGRDHMRATGDPVFKRGALDFLSRVY